jgi:sec-independent protein translocase protein TatC
MNPPLPGNQSPSVTGKREVMGPTPPKAVKPSKDPTASMSFLDHLEELRWRLFKGLAGLFIGIFVAFFFRDFFINELILGPTRPDFFMYKLIRIEAVELSLISRKLPGQFFTYWGTLIVVGFIVGSPLTFYQLWAFVAPALEQKEKIKTFLNASFITFFFLLGVAFGYLILVPFAVQFFTQFVITDVISNEFDINEYFTSVAMWTLACGIIFQIPVVSYFLSKVELLTPEFLKKYWRQAVVIILVLSAFITPPDPISQVLIALPLTFLYQLAIFTSKIAIRSNERARAKRFES